MNNELNESFWTSLYEQNDMGWNIGYVSTPLKTYFDQLEDKSIQILIPGAGNSYEAEYLFNQGFENVHVVDISKRPLSNLKKRIPSFPDAHLHHINFFDFEGQFDLIVEQTFFCALNPKLRQQYADKMLDLLKPNGKIVGLYFDFVKTEDLDQPPFSGSVEEYKNYFKAFRSANWERCYNSIPSRAGKEMFGIIKK